MCRWNAYFGQPLVVSEPPGAWLEIPESTALVIQPGEDEQRPFRPQRP
jgi:hypothetical protein